jgi:hypothetical protein
LNKTVYSEEAMSQLSQGFAIEPAFSMEAVIRRSISTLFSYPTLFFGLATLAALSSMAVQPLTHNTSSLGLVFLLALFSGLLLYLVQGAIACGVVIVLIGNDEPEWSEVCSKAFVSIGRLFLLVLCLALFVGGCTLILIPLTYFMGKAALLIVALPALVLFAALFCSWALAAPICVLEELGPIKALYRSAELTRGYRWQILGLFVLAFVCFGTVAFVLLIPLGAPSTDSGHLLYLIQSLPLFILSTFNTAFIDVMVGVIYCDLVAIKDKEETAPGEPAE